MQFMRIDFQTFFLKGTSFPRTYRLYFVTEKGRDFIQNPTAVLVASPFEVTKKPPSVTPLPKSKKDNGGLHYVPVIKCMLADETKWLTITTKEHNEFPGFSASNVLFHSADYKKETFAAKSRPHYMSDDNQLTKSSSQTQIHTVAVNGQEIKLNIRRSFCEGVKVCSGGDCSGYVVTNRQKVNRCPRHADNKVLNLTGKCPTQFVYIWPVEDDGKRWVGTIGDRNHPRPAPRKILTKVQEDIQSAAKTNIRSTAKDILKGLGMPYIPGEQSIAAVNVDRVRRER